MAISSLGHVGIHVRDMERSKAFYRDVLGLKVNDESERIIFMSAQDRLAEHHELVLHWTSMYGQAKQAERNMGIETTRYRLLHTCKVDIEPRAPGKYVRRLPLPKPPASTGSAADDELNFLFGEGE